MPARTSPTLLPHPLALCCHYPVSKFCSASIVVTSTVRVNMEHLLCCSLEASTTEEIDDWVYQWITTKYKTSKNRSSWHSLKDEGQCRVARPNWLPYEYRFLVLNRSNKLQICCQHSGLVSSTETWSSLSYYCYAPLFTKFSWRTMTALTWM